MIVEHRRRGIEIKLASQMTLFISAIPETIKLETEFGEVVEIQLAAVGELMFNGQRWCDLTRKTEAEKSSLSSNPYKSC
jgi:hypothetical protein